MSASIRDRRTYSSCISSFCAETKAMPFMLSFVFFCMYSRTSLISDFDFVSHFVTMRYMGRFDNSIFFAKSVSDFVICWFMSVTSRTPSALGKKFTNAALCRGSDDESPGVSTRIVDEGIFFEVSKTSTIREFVRRSFFSSAISEISSVVPSFFTTVAEHCSALKKISYIVAVVGTVATSSFLLSVSAFISVVLPELNSPTSGRKSGAFSIFMVVAISSSFFCKSA